MIVHGLYSKLCAVLSIKDTKVMRYKKKRKSLFITMRIAFLFVLHLSRKKNPAQSALRQRICIINHKTKMRTNKLKEEEEQMKK